MNFPEELKEKIKILFKNNKDIKEKLLAGNPDTIREIGSMSQLRIDPEEVVKAYESNNSSAMEKLYKKAKKMAELQKLYLDLCNEYNKEIIEQNR